ncbi:MAG: sugar-binding transcriptional regulator [Anaerolineales bacterium]|nr:sugar-binding transcriptional regulator [Anaerolineales bacterium]
MARKLTEDRDNLLADVAEMYFVEGMNQSEISKQIGVTRSMVSRMLTEARSKEIVKIQIDRRFEFDHKIQAEITRRFALEDAVIFTGYVEDSFRYLSRLGSVAANVIQPYIKPGITLGTAWGTALDATINALEVQKTRDIKVIQLVGALRGRNLDIDGHGVVQHLVTKTGGVGYFLNVPYIVDKPETIKSLMQVPGVSSTMQLMKECDVGLFGVGSADLDYSTFYSGGYLIAEEMRGLIQFGAVGNVAGLFFNLDGKPTGREFQARSFTISRRDLMEIPVRFGIAGGMGKVKAILGALRGKYINILITDAYTAKGILEMDAEET